MTNEAKEFHFTQSDFDKVRAVLYDLSGIDLSVSKDSMVYSRLARRLRALRLSNFSDYLNFLANDPNEAEHFINGLTTNLTSFFRENHHFDILSDYLKQAKGHQRIWCTASSTGEEPYSIAMCAAEAYGSLTPPISIIATDIDSNVLRIADNGIYPEDRVRSLSPQRLKQFFYRGVGRNLGKVKVVPEIRNLVSFGKLNLTESRWPNIEGDFDIIFCRNVMIYFDKPTQLKVLNKLVSRLSDTGLYFAGHSESFLSAANVVVPVGKTVYRKVKKH